MWLGGTQGYEGSKLAFLLGCCWLSKQLVIYDMKRTYEQKWPYFLFVVKVIALKPEMLTRSAGHEAKADAEERKSEAKDEAETQNFFRGRGHNV